MIHFLVGVVFTQGKTQGAVGNVMDTADGQQHMAGVKRTGGAGRAGRCADTVHIQQEQQGFALNALEAEADVAGEAVDCIAVQGAVGNLA